MDTRNIYCSIRAGSYFVQLEETTWADARQYCADNDAHLMEVRTQEEYDRALGHWDKVGNFWLGGNDIEQEGVWIWISNGERMSMDRFWATSSDNPAHDNPNNSQGSEHCLEMWGIGFNDVICSEPKVFICENN